MFTTGSKLLIGSAAAAWLAAAVYGIAQEGTLGTLGLISAAVALSFLAGLNLFVRDSNVSAMDPDGFDAAAAAQATARPSLWPLLVGLGVTTMTLGLATYRAIFVLGLIALAAGALEWVVQGWSERASRDAAFNSDVRHQFADPLEMPVAAAIGAGVVVFSFSRVMLGLPSKTATVVAFSVVAALILAVGAYLGLQRGISKTAMTGAFSLGAIALIAGGTVAGLNGERKTEEHHTTEYIAKRNECGTEETEADEKASQTVAGKSNNAEVVLDESGLSANVVGYDGNFAAMTLPRANPNNILFRNKTAEPARLVIELHPAVDQNGVPLGPERLCTALVDEGGVQLLTVYFQQPSFAVDGGYEFTVPGTDATLEVTVP
jgi:hypothetical protein